MDYNLLGFIKASKNRVSIIRLLGEDILTPKEISKTLNIHTSQISRYLSELMKKELVKVLTPNLRKGRIYTLTKNGKRYLNALKR